MSGGHFSYVDLHMEQAADELKEYIDRCVNEEPDEFGWVPYHPQEIIDKFKEVEKMLRVSAIHLHRVDWLICGDDGDETFVKRLQDDLEKLEEQYDRKDSV